MNFLVPPAQIIPILRLNVNLVVEKVATKRQILIAKGNSSYKIEIHFFILLYPSYCFNQFI